jgi:hypothetical protein
MDRLFRKRCGEKQALALLWERLFAEDVDRKRFSLKWEAKRAKRKEDADLAETCKFRRQRQTGNGFMLNDRENILKALREKPLKVYEIMRRVNLMNEESCQSLLLKMRDVGSVKFDIHKGRWLIE